MLRYIELGQFFSTNIFNNLLNLKHTVKNMYEIYR